MLDMCLTRVIRARKQKNSHVSVTLPLTFPLRLHQPFGQQFGQDSVSVDVSVTLPLRDLA